MLLVSATRPAPDTSLRGTVRFTITGPAPAPGVSYTVDPHDVPVVSPDGRTLALPLETPEEKALYIRPLNSLDLIRIEGGGRRPFFSPDGASLAFTRFGAIWRMNLGERQPSLVGQLDEVLWDVGFSAWHPDGRLLIPGIAGLWSLPSSGGDATLLLAADSAKFERFRGVSVLPDDRLLLHVQMGETSRIEALSSTATERRIVSSGFERGLAVEDILITRHRGQWRATRLDLERLEPTGQSIPLSDVPETTDNPLGRSFASIEGSSLVRELVWVSRSGVENPVGIAPAYMRWPRLSPDGTRIALGVLPSEILRSNLRNDVRLGVFDLRTRARTTLEGFSEPVWTATGASVITSAAAPPEAGLGEQVADGSRKMERLFSVEQGDAWPTSVSRDGTLVVSLRRVAPRGRRYAGPRRYLRARPRDTGTQTTAARRRPARRTVVTRRALAGIRVNRSQSHRNPRAIVSRFWGRLHGFAGGRRRGFVVSRRQGAVLSAGAQLDGRQDSSDEQICRLAGSTGTVQGKLRARQLWGSELRCGARRSFPHDAASRQRTSLRAGRPRLARRSARRARRGEVTSQVGEPALQKFP